MNAGLRPQVLDRQKANTESDSSFLKCFIHFSHFKVLVWTYNQPKMQISWNYV